ncbi:MAG: hypothetical protein WA063_00850 [Minisyncoccia bacterium]
MRFGESFPTGAAPENRMNPFRSKEEEEDLPSYAKFGLEVRNKLQESFEKNRVEFPNPDNIKNTEDLFEFAKDTINNKWNSDAHGLLADKISEWKNELRLEIAPEDAQAKQALDLMDNPNDFLESFEINQFGVLEILRKYKPEAWRCLISASSERQLASVSLLSHWLKDKTNQDSMDKVINNIGISKAEIELFVKLAAIFGKYIDHAYIKQIELADSKGGSDKTSLSGKQGAEYLYDLYVAENENKIDVKSYKDIFPFEWSMIEKRFQQMSERINKSVKEGKLPETYLGLSDLLDSMSKTYGSKTIDPGTLDSEWKALYKKAGEIVESGCPIMIMPQGAPSVAGEASKVDVELRFGLRTEKTKAMEENIGVFMSEAQAINKNYESLMDGHYDMPKPRVNFQPWAYGPNLYWMTRGQSGKERMTTHANSVAEVSKNKEIPLMKKVFEEEFEDKDYLDAAIIETSLHEIGHIVLSDEDKKVSERIGKGPHENALDELKAETIGMSLLNNKIKRDEVPEGVDLRSQLLAKLGGNVDYLKNKSSERVSSGERYYLCGIAIFVKLFEKKLIIKTQSGKYSIGDTKECINAISEMSNDLVPLYTDDSSKPEDVEKYIDKIRELKNNSQIKEFIEYLKE